MPDKRDPNKVGLVFYLDRDVKRKAQEILKKKQITFTQFINVAVYKLIEMEDNEIIKTLESYDCRTKKGKTRINSQKK
jgi:hypothetical protein